MVLELKGLKAKAIKAAANIDRLNVAYDKFNEMAPAHAADVEGLAPQVEGLVEDLTFAAQTLGNSAGRSEDSETGKETPKPPPAVQRPEAPKVPSVPNVAQDMASMDREVGQAAQGTFPEAGAQDG